MYDFSTINHQPSTINHQPSTINHQPSISDFFNPQRKYRRDTSRFHGYPPTLKPSTIFSTKLKLAARVPDRPK
jgi:hypothetical protein